MMAAPPARLNFRPVQRLFDAISVKAGHFEIDFGNQHLRQQKGNIAATAREIGVHPVFLRQKIARLGIDAKIIKSEGAKV